MNNCHHSTCYLSCTKNLTVPGSLLLPINALQKSFHHYLLLALKPYLLIINNIVMVFISTLEVIVFGLLITLLKYWAGYIKLIRPQELDDLIVMILPHYIRISHDTLKNNIRNLVCEVFKIRGAKYLIVYMHGKAHWS